MGCKKLFTAPVAAMVIKTEACAFLEYKIYPGNGQKFIARDGKTSFFISAKADSLFHQKIKASKLSWSQTWRRMHKKNVVTSVGRKGKKKTTKFQKAIVGLSLDDMKKKRGEKMVLRQQAKEETAAKEAKLKQKKAANKASMGKTQQKSNQKAPTNRGANKVKDFKGKK